MAISEYDNFDLEVEGLDGRSFRVTARSRHGSASREVSAPFSELELQNFILRAGLSRGPSPRRGVSPARDAARELGRALFDTFLGGNVGEALESAAADAEAEGVGLRIRLQLDRDSEMVHYPWEFWNRSIDDQFLVLSRRTPIVRYIDTGYSKSPRAIEPPLRIILVVSDPVDSSFPKLDVGAERRSVTRALDPLITADLVELVVLERATLNALRDALNEGGGHIVHFVGHGVFDEATGEGLLEMEDVDGRSRLVPGRDLGTMLLDYDVRLVVLNSCEGARNETSDPFAGAATSLILKGIPAVIAMQFEITDTAAEQLARAFYAGIVRSEPVDTALTEARLRLFGGGSDTEWATPVLYLQTESGRLFEMATEGETAVPELVSESQRAIDRDDWSEAARLISRAEVFRPEDSELAAHATEVRRRVDAAARTDEVRWLAENGDANEAYSAMRALIDDFPELEADEELKQLVNRLEAPRVEPAVAASPPAEAPPRRMPEAAPPERVPGVRRRLMLLWAVIAVLVAVAIAFGVLAFRAPEVPDVTSRTETNARELLEAAGISVSEPVVEVQSEQPAGIVLDQEPQEGARSRTVMLTVSLGPPKRVPEVVGLPQEEALARLAAEEIAVSTTSRSDDAPAGTVIEVVPPEGAEADGAVIVISSGPPPPQLPALTGSSIDEATELLDGEGISYTIEQREDDAAEGTVIGQSPAAGEPSSQVVLVVSAGPGLPVVPDVVGLTQEEAVALLGEQDIAVEVIVTANPEVPRGHVMAQSPAPDERADSVEMEVSDGPGFDDYLGTWDNIDEETRGTTRLVISASGDTTVDVEGFGSCVPTDCQWGVTSGRFVDGVIEATFEFGYKATTLRIERAGAVILVEQFDDYTDADGREDRASAYSMSKVPLRQLTTEDISIIAEFDLLDSILGTPGGVNIVELLPDPEPISP